MANPEHLKILKQGVEAWNQWRKANPGIVPWLRLIHWDELGKITLSGGDFHGADLMGAMLKGANLRGANLAKANLADADLDNADFTNANLRGANLGMGAWFPNTDFSNADLSFANLSRAFLESAKFIGATVDGTDFRKAHFNRTLICDCNLQNVKGLESVYISGPCYIGIDTLYKSQGQIPDKFLGDAGVPEEIIDIARSLRAGPAIQWHSCFISYSTKDEEFARRLHSRMREANMRVWIASKDLKGGKKLHEQLFEAIQIHDRLLIVLSEYSIQSEWVMTEIRKARETEKNEKRRKLFPIRLTDFETLRVWTCFDADTGKDLAVEVREYYIPDFSNWKDHDAFESAFARLKKDLEAENSKK